MSFHQLSAAQWALGTDPGAVKSGADWRTRSYCHNGDGRNLCFRDGDKGVLAVCSSRGCSFSDIMRAARARLGDVDPCQIKAPLDARGYQGMDRAERIRRAVAYFNMSQPAAEYVRTYLGARAYQGLIPDTFRERATARFGDAGDHPLMVCVAQNGITGSRQACQRIALNSDGSWKADIADPKRALGPIKGAAIRLGQLSPGQTLIVGEGIESSLSAMDLARSRGRNCVAWAAISAPGLRALGLAEDIRDVVIAADRGQAGESAADAAAGRWRSEGRSVEVVLPPVRFGDFNEFAMARAGLIGGAG